MSNTHATRLDGRTHSQSCQKRCSWALCARLSVACVWLYQGLWCKLLLPNEIHREVVASIPYLGSAWAPYVLTGIGLLETALGLWVLSGQRLRRAAIVQSGLLLAMNVGGLIWAADSIHDPGAMLASNVAFLVLAWGIANPEANR